SSAKESFADIVLALLGEKEITGTVRNPRMAARKRRGGRQGEEFAFTTQLVPLRIDEDGDQVDTLIIEWGGTVDLPEPTSGWPKSLRLFHRILMAQLAEHGVEIQPGGERTVHAIDRELVRTEFYKSYPADGEDEKQRTAARRKAFQRAIQDAQNRALIGV